MRRLCIESGATPICANINETLNMDPDDLIKKINKKTKAVIIVHMLGVPAQVDKIKTICKKYKITLIEDTAWGCGGKYKNRFWEPGVILELTPLILQKH